jgi:hypothetical protein
MIAMALIILDHEEEQMQRYKRSMSGLSAALDGNQEASHEHYTGTTSSHQTFVQGIPFLVMLSDVNKCFLVYPTRSAGVR